MVWYKLVEPYSDEEINEALAIAAGREQSDGKEEVLGDDSHTAFRRHEFNALLQNRRDDQLVVSSILPDEYENEFSQYFSGVSLVEKLRETRVLRGFTRVYPENDMDNAALQSLMRVKPPDEGERWLPAYVVHGEGVFLRLNEERLQEWEAREDVNLRVRSLVERYRSIQEARHLRDRSISRNRSVLE